MQEISLWKVFFLLSQKCQALENEFVQLAGSVQPEMRRVDRLELLSDARCFGWSSLGTDICGVGQIAAQSGIDHARSRIAVDDHQPRPTRFNDIPQPLDLGPSRKRLAVEDKVARARPIEQVCDNSE